FCQDTPETAGASRPSRVPALFLPHRPFLCRTSRKPTTRDCPQRFPTASQDTCASCPAGTSGIVAKGCRQNPRNLSSSGTLLREAVDRHRALENFPANVVIIRQRYSSRIRCCRAF